MRATATGNIQRARLGYGYGLAIGIGLVVVLSTVVAKRSLQAYYLAEERRKESSSGRSRRRRRRIGCAPRHLLDQQLLPVVPGNEIPYLPSSLPGGRLVDTPYGFTQVYEWGPREGDKVLFLPGISTPVASLGNLGEELVTRGYRVMMFDLYGRGWSDNPTGVPHDDGLYVSQIMFALASSPLAWTGSGALHLVGYSLGGGLAVSFARYFPDILASLCLLAPAGLVLRRHLDWRGRLLYSCCGSVLLPGWLLTLLVRKRLEPAAAAAVPEVAAVVADSRSSSLEEDPAAAAAALRPTLVVSNHQASTSGNGDASGGDAFDQAVIWPDRPAQVTVAALVSWQLKHHSGFLPAFVSTMRHAPIFEQTETWSVVAGHMERRRGRSSENDPQSSSPISRKRNGVVLLIQGTEDTVIPPRETVADAEAVFGKEGLHTVLLEGGHEIPITRPEVVADALVSYWTRE